MTYTRRPATWLRSRFVHGAAVVFVGTLLVAWGGAMLFLPGGRDLTTASRIYGAFAWISAVASIVAGLSAGPMLLYGDRKAKLDEAERQDRELKAQEQIRAARAETAALAGRRVAVEQADILNRTLSGAPGATLRIYSADAESHKYAEQLADAIRAGGWTVYPLSGAGLLGGGPSPGNMLQFRGAESERDYMEADRVSDLRPSTLVPAAGVVLAEALSAAGIATRYAIMYGGPPGEMELFIGYKP